MKKLFMLIVLGIFLISLASLVFAAGTVIWSGNSITRFEIVTTDPVCDNENFYWKSWPPEGELLEQPSLDDCFRDNGWPSTTCCPETNTCKLTGSAPFRCLGGPAPTYCSEYITENDCKAFHLSVGIRSVEKYKGEGYCGSTQSSVIQGKTCQWDVWNCRCEWVVDAQNENGGSCEQKYSQTNTLCDGILGEDEGECLLTETNVEDNCQGTPPTITFSWDAKYILKLTGEEGTDPTGECIPDTREVPCMSTAMLSFFTTLSLIIAILLLIIFYAIIIKKKKKFSKKKRK